MVSVLASSAGGRGFDPRPGQTKDIKIGICCFSARHAALRSKSKDWLPRVRIMCLGKVACLPADCCFRELARKNPAQRVGLVQSRIHSSSLINMFSSWYAWNICHWTLSIIQSINQLNFDGVSLVNFLTKLIWNGHLMYDYLWWFSSNEGTKSSCSKFWNLDFCGNFFIRFILVRASFQIFFI